MKELKTITSKEFNRNYSLLVGEITIFFFLVFLFFFNTGFTSILLLPFNTLITLFLEDFVDLGDFVFRVFFFDSGYTL